MAKPRDRGLPSYVLTLFNVPLHRRRSVGVQPAGLRAAELRPIGGGQIGCEKQGNWKQNCFHVLVTDLNVRGCPTGSRAEFVSPVSSLGCIPALAPRRFSRVTSVIGFFIAVVVAL